jgi:hypothetical protein
MSDDKKPCIYCGGINEWHDPLCRTQKPKATHGSIDAAKAYTDKKCLELLSYVQRADSDSITRVDTLSARVDNHFARSYDVDKLRAAHAANIEALAARVEELEKRADTVEAVSGVKLGLSERIAKLEEMVNSAPYRLLSSVQERLRQLEQANRGLASQAAGASIEPGSEPGATLASEPGRNREPAPIAIEVGQVWRSMFEDYTIQFVGGELVKLHRDGSPNVWNISKTDLLRVATLVEPAPEKEEAQADVNRRLMSELGYTVHNAWAANVPEPPPVGSLIFVAVLVEERLTGNGRLKGGAGDVASWLRAVAAAMGGGK